MAKLPTTEQYDKLIKKIGKPATDAMIKALERHNEELILQGQRYHELQLKRLENIIPKKELIDCQHYTGYRERGTHVAMWDEREGVFITTRYKFGFQIERVPYILDVIETKFDGFFPFKLVEEIEIK